MVAAEVYQEAASQAVALTETGTQLGGEGDTELAGDVMRDGLAVRLALEAPRLIRGPRGVAEARGERACGGYAGQARA